MKLRLGVIFFLFSSLLNAQQNGLNIHGFINQAYAVSRGYEIFGIPEKGSTDYRTLAIQFRYDASEHSTFVIQFSHKRMGNSPIMQKKSDVELDWAFYEYHINDKTSFKFGRIQVPFGIYNEIRDVGVLLPFYQVPYTPYGEGNYTSETVNGITVCQKITRFNPWRIQLELYAGEWQWIEWAIFKNPLNQSNIEIVEDADFKNALGAQLWVETPMEGIRLGLGGYRGKVRGGIQFVDEVLGEEILYEINFSVDARLDNSFFRSELGRVKILHNNIYSNAFNSTVGFYLTDRWCLNLQAEVHHIKGAVVLPEWRRTDLDFFEDVALGLNYEFSPSLVLKLENHWNRSYIIEEPIDITRPPLQTQYTIFSFSSSF
ncbi:MAG: hypothetical protein D6748_15055 [Calditrichaeota bacterium]|nr:MAG: hypothetical protein D6748_15055 [Calditrichota bacterium]